MVHSFIAEHEFSGCEEGGGSILFSKIFRFRGSFSGKGWQLLAGDACLLVCGPNWGKQIHALSVQSLPMSKSMVLHTTRSILRFHGIVEMERVGWLGSKGF